VRLFRFCRMSLRSLTILIEQFPVFFQLSWLCVAVSLLSDAVAGRYPVLAGVCDLLARGIFAVAWLRLVALGEMPHRFAYFRLGRREILAAFGWMLAEIFIIIPAHVIAASLSIATGIGLADLITPLVGLAHLLLGAAYMLPAEAALENASDKVNWRLPELVMRGGIAIGIAVALAWLPANLLLEGTKLLPGIELADGLALPQAAAILVRYLSIAVTAGTMALIWIEMTAAESGYPKL
jgi:hypothetical protein